MTTTTENTVQWNSIVQATRLVAGSYLNGISEAYRTLSEAWAQGIKGAVFELFSARGE